MKSKRITLFASAAALAAALAALAPSGAFAQAAAPAAAPSAPGAAAENILRIRTVTDVKSDYAQKVVPLGSRSGRQKIWGVFDVTFDTAPEWLDDISITYTVMLLNDKPKQGEKPMSLYTASFDYPNIAQGRDHKAGVVIAPNVLLRYGRPIGFAVQIAVGGVTIEQGAGEGVLKSRDKWWKDPAITGSPQVQKRDGLVERAKSPFALVDIDSYEVAK